MQKFLVTTTNRYVIETQEELSKVLAVMADFDEILFEPIKSKNKGVKDVSFEAIKVRREKLGK